MLSTGGWVLPSVLLFAGILNGSSRPQEVYLPTFPLQYMLAKNTEIKRRKHAHYFRSCLGPAPGQGRSPDSGPAVPRLVPVHVASLTGAQFPTGA